MTRRAKVWLVVAALFIVANAVFAGLHAVHGQVIQACIHVALLLAAEYLVWRKVLRERVSG